MRLLAKSDIAKAKANAQRQSIDEGVKLARRIDSLREVASEEEASLERFRRESLVKIHADIKEAKEELDTLISENRRLERENKELRKPLDAEWEELSNAKGEVAFEKEEVASRAADLERERKAVLEDRQAGNRLLIRAANAESLAEEKLQRATRLEGETGKLRNEARDALESARKIKEAAEREFVHRDMEMASRERGVILKMESLEAKDKELTAWSLRLLDQEQTLEREFNRLKKRK